MRKRIRQIARGKFEYDRPTLALPEEELSLSAMEGQEYTGSFTITSTNHIPVRGVIYSTNPRMECLTPQFEGEEIRVRYQFHNRGLVEGQTQKGDFVIICNQSVHSLPFCVSISRRYAESSVGSVRSLSDFTNLAKENWTEAYQLFYHKHFGNIIKPKEIREAMIYRGICAAKPSPQNMEEFLVGIRKKKQISFTIDQTSCVLQAVTQTQQFTTEIKKSEWGYLVIHVSADADFIRLSDKKITTEDFLGSSYTCRYLIDPERMHAGNNYGRITFSSAYETRVLEVKAHKGIDQTVSKDSVRAQIMECRAGLVELYEAYRLKQIVTGVWSNETVEILNHLQAMLPDEPMYRLMKAQALVINRQRQEAEWILDEFKREWQDRRSPEWGYYLYIMTLMEREPSYVDRMTREIELIFYENPDSAVLFWTLLFLKEEYYNNSAYKLKAIHSWVMNGCASPYLYVEAYYLIWQEPYLLSSLGEFEVRILRWAIRHHALTRELAAQIFEIVEVNKGFDRIHFALLEAAYEVEPEPEKVGFICSYLIRAQKFDAKYHHWFEAGIELELRITSLYEAYLLSFDEREIGSVPKIIQMYFQYDSNLPYRKMAILYNNIIASKDNHPEIYQQYRRIMGRFAMEQLEQEHMDDNLAVLYEEMLDLGLVNEELAHCLAQILFTHKLVLFDKRMVRAIIYQKQMAEPQIVPIVERAAYFQLYSDTYVVLFEDEKGKRYVNSVSYRMESLMEPEPYLEKCMSLAPDELPYLIAYFEKKKEEGSISKEDEKYFPRILFAKELDPTYQARLARQILQYYETTGQQTVVQEYLAQVDLEPMPQSVRQYMLDQMVHYRMYEQSYEHLVYYGIDQMGVAERVTLASDRIRQQENGEDADEQLLLLCTSVFVRKKYNDSILKYLSDFYYGPTEQMLRLWRAARAFEIDTFELEERILVQILYSDADLTDAEEIFVHYYENGGRELMILAYLTMGAHRYFVEQTKIPVSVPKILCDRYQNGRELNDACKLALLKLLSEEEVGGEDSYRMQEELLAEYTCRNMNFAFYKKLDKRLVQKYHLYDKVFLEYRTDPRKRVILHYSREEDGENFVTVDMQDVYDGIFVEPFILFFGESVQYYITEEFGNEVEVTESNRLTGNDYYAQKDESRYNLINQMLMSEMLSDEKALHQKMKQYAEYDVVTQKVFKLL